MNQIHCKQQIQKLMIYYIINSPSLILPISSGYLADRLPYSGSVAVFKTVSGGSNSNSMSMPVSPYATAALATTGAATLGRGRIGRSDDGSNRIQSVGGDSGSRAIRIRDRN